METLGSAEFETPATWFVPTYLTQFLLKIEQPMFPTTSFPGKKSHFLIEKKLWNFLKIPIKVFQSFSHEFNKLHPFLANLISNWKLENSFSKKGSKNEILRKRKSKKKRKKERKKEGRKERAKERKRVTAFSGKKFPFFQFLLFSIWWPNKDCLKSQ